MTQALPGFSEILGLIAADAERWGCAGRRTALT